MKWTLLSAVVICVLSMRTFGSVAGLPTPSIIVCLTSYLDCLVFSSMAMRIILLILLLLMCYCYFMTVKIAHVIWMMSFYFIVSCCCWNLLFWCQLKFAWSFLFISLFKSLYLLCPVIIKLSIADYNFTVIM